jgi:hypothetical protein
MLLVFIFMIRSLYAQDGEVVNIEEFCKGPEVIIRGMNYVIKEDGFCKTLAEIKKENKEPDKDFVRDVNSALFQLQNIKTFSNCGGQKSVLENLFGNNNEKNDKWKIRFYASHSFTTYFSTDMKFRSSRYNVDIDNYEWQERGSRDFFQPETWKKEGNNPFQMIDEPSNTFTLSIEKNGNEFFLSAFHPKFLQQVGQVKPMVGTVDGVAVDGNLPINRPVDHYSPVPGEMRLVRNQNTHMQMMFEVGYGHRFKLLEGKTGSIVYVPSLALGVTTGQNLTVTVEEGKYWDFEEHQQKNSIQGFGGTITNRVEVNSKNERFGLFVENRFSLYKQKHGFMDGTQEYDLKLMGNSVGIKFMIYNPKNHKKGP